MFIVSNSSGVVVNNNPAQKIISYPVGAAVGDTLLLILAHPENIVDGLDGFDLVGEGLYKQIASTFDSFSVEMTGGVSGSSAWLMIAIRDAARVGTVLTEVQVSLSDLAGDFQQVAPSDPNALVLWISRFQAVSSVGSAQHDNGSNGGSAGTVSHIALGGGVIATYQIPSGALTPECAFSSTVNVSGSLHTLVIKPDTAPTNPSALAINPTTPDRQAVISYTPGTDPDGDPVIVEAELSIDGGGSYNPFFMGAVGATSVNVDFSAIAAGTNNRIRYRSKSGNLSSAWVVSGLFTIIHVPSAPVVFNPVAGSRRVKGVPFTISWEKSVSATYPQSQIKYEIQVSNAGNIDAAYHAVVTTAVNVNSHAYNFSTEPASVNTWLRIRGIDPANNLGAWTVVGAFEVANDTAPGAPNNITPLNGSAFNRFEGMTLAADLNDLGDLMTAYEIKWSTNGGASYPNTTGLIAVANLARFTHNFAANLFPHQVIFYQIFTKDFAGTLSPAATISLLAGEKPATPAFSFPLNLGSITDSNLTAQWSSVGQQAFELILTDNLDVQILTSGVIASAVEQWAIPLNLVNGRTYKLKLRIRNNENLWSNVATVTFTVTFAQPPVPSQTVTALPALGLNRVQITNPSGGSGVAKNSIFRYIVSEGIASAIRIKDNVAVNGSYDDKTAPPRVEVGYYVKAISVSGLFSESDNAPSTVTLNLQHFWITIMDGTDRLYKFTASSIDEVLRYFATVTDVEGVNADGSPVLPVITYSKRLRHGIAVRVYARKKTDEYDNLKAVLNSLSTICVRAGYKNFRYFVGFNELSANYRTGGQEVNIPLNRVRYIEDLQLLEML